MFGIVGYLRTIAALALMLDTAARAADPAEPLTITPLPDAEKEVLLSTATDNAPGANSDAFSLAVSDSVRAQQQSMQSSCLSVPTASSSIAARWAWEARCRYKRY
jgi:hypothetical protein